MNGGALTASQFIMGAPGAAQILGGNMGVKVVFHNGGPKTNGETIYLPHLPLEADKETVDMLLGDLIHEIAHVKDTDFDVMRAFGPLGDVLHGIFNAVEDPRIEKYIMGVYPGARSMLEGSVKVMIAKGQIKTGETPAEALQCFIDFWGASVMNGMSVLDDLLESVKVKLAETLGDDGVRRVEALLSMRFPKLRNTMDAIELSRKILILVKDIAEEQKQQQQQNSQGGSPQQSNDQSQDNGNSSQSKATGQGDGDSDDANGSAKGDSGDDSADSAPSQTVSSAGGKGKGDDDAIKGKAQAILDEDDSSIASPVRDYAAAYQEVADQDIADNPKGLTSRDVDGYFADVGNTTVQANEVRWQQLFNDISGTIAVLQREMLRLLSKARSSRKVTTQAGRLRTNRLAQIKRGNPNVFYRKVKSKVPESAVSFVVDVSGSMSGKEEQVCSTTLIALAEACNRARIPFEVTTFESNAFRVVKSFADTYAATKPRFGGLDTAIAGTTPLGHAMYEAGKRLAKRTEQRRIMFCLTDGDSDCGGQIVQKMDEMMTQAGMDVLGIGICSSSVERNFRQSAVVHSLADLGPTLFKSLSRVLIKPAA